MTAILFTIDSKGTVYGYDDTPSQQALAEQRIADGQTIYTPPAPDSRKLIDTQTSIINNAIQLSLDVGAQSWGYDNILSGVSYAGSENPQFNSDGTLLSQWRTDVWAWAIPLYPTITPTTTPEEFMATMPAQPKQIIVPTASVV